MKKFTQFEKEVRDKLIGRNSNELRFGNTSNEEVERQWDLNTKLNKVFIF